MSPSPTRSFLLALAALWPAASAAFPVTYVASSGSDALSWRPMTAMVRPTVR